MLKIITDSSSNIFQSEADAMGVKILPLGISFGDDAYLDDVTLSIDEFYEKLTTSDDFPKTSLLSMEALEEEFQKAKDAGDEVLLLPISSKLSGSFNAASLVKNSGGFDNAYVYDTKATTLILRIMVETALKHRDKSAAEVIAILDDLRPRLNLLAGLDTLDYLHKGGRLSKAKAVIGGMFSVKPIITITQDGGLDVVAKAKGGINNIIKTIHPLVEQSGELDLDYPVYFLYAQDDTNVIKLQESFTNLQDSKAFNLCSVVGCHTGPNLCGIVYVTKK